MNGVTTTTTTNQTFNQFSNIFITVGTTDFDELMKAISTDIFVSTIEDLNCAKLTIQIGRGSFEPKDLVKKFDKRGKVNCSYYRFKPSLDDDMRQSDLIITHCGAGSIIESLSLEKIFITVVNSSLQDNHQTELADQLSYNRYCIASDPVKLISDIQCLQKSAQKLIKFPKNDNSLFPYYVNKLCGII